MSWSIGFDKRWKRDIGYGVPATCDHPGCGASIDRGISYVCGGQPYGGKYGCGLYFCSEHQKTAGDGRENVQLCTRCYRGRSPYRPTKDVPEWIQNKLKDESWSAWRAVNHEVVKAMRESISQSKSEGQGADNAE